MMGQSLRGQALIRSRGSERLVRAGIGGSVRGQSEDDSVRGGPDLGPENDGDGRVDDDDQRLGDTQWADLQGRLLKDGADDSRSNQRIDRPMLQYCNWTRCRKHIGGRLDKRSHEGPGNRGRGGVERGPTDGRSPSRHDRRHGDGATEDGQRGRPIGDVGLQVTAMGFGGGQKDRQRRAGDDGSGPRGLGDVLMDPEPPKEQGEDQFGDEEGLDDRELPAVEGDRLEGESSSRRRPTQEPDRLTDQECDEIKASVRFVRTMAGCMLAHQVEGVCQGGCQSEEDGDDLGDTHAQLGLGHESTIIGRLAR